MTCHPEDKKRSTSALPQRTGAEAGAHRRRLHSQKEHNERAERRKNPEKTRFTKKFGSSSRQDRMCDLSSGDSGLARKALRAVHRKSVAFV